jgi:hypothetical protein
LQANLMALDALLGEQDRRVREVHALARRFNTSVWQSSAQLEFIAAKRESYGRRVAEMSREPRFSSSSGGGSSEESNVELKSLAKTARMAAQEQMRAAERLANGLNASLTQAQDGVARVAQLVAVFDSLTSASSEIGNETRDEHLKMRDEAVELMNEALGQKEAIASLVKRLDEMNTQANSGGEQQTETVRAQQLVRLIDQIATNVTDKVSFNSCFWVVDG